MTDNIDVEREEAKKQKEKAIIALRILDAFVLERQEQMKKKRTKRRRALALIKEGREYGLYLRRRTREKIERVKAQKTQNKIDDNTEQRGLDEF